MIPLNLAFISLSYLIDMYVAHCFSRFFQKADNTCSVMEVH